MNISKGADTLAKWSAIAIGFSVPISTAMDNVLLFVVLISWLAGGGFKQKLTTIKANPVALAALAFFGLLVAGCFYGQGTGAEALYYLGKYLDVLFIPILICLFKEEKARRFAIAGFMLAMALTLALSYIIKIGIFPQSTLLQGMPDNSYVFKLHITQNIFMAFFAYLLAMKARYAESPRLRMAFALAAVLAAYNVLFMVQGRTGYLVLAVLLVYFCIEWLRWKGLLVATIASALLGATVYFGSTTLHNRVTKAASEFSQWQPDVASESSIGVRLEFYRNSLDLVREHPLFGSGTGGFVHAYAEKVKNSSMWVTRNPHNEYLLIAIQLGLLGMGLLLYLFYRQWSLATLLPTPLEQNLARGLLLTVASGSLVNSLLLDHAEGLFFAWMSGLLFAGLNTVQRRSEGRN